VLGARNIPLLLAISVAAVVETPTAPRQLRGNSQEAGASAGREPR